jgi:hypothetical protein
MSIIRVCLPYFIPMLFSGYILQFDQMKEYNGESANKALIYALRITEERRMTKQKGDQP